MEIKILDPRLRGDDELISVSLARAIQRCDPLFQRRVAGEQGHPA